MQLSLANKSTNFTTFIVSIGIKGLAKTLVYNLWNHVTFSPYFSIGVTVAFSQSTFTASEGDGFVQVCAELLTGDLETEISLLVEVLDLESNSGRSNACSVILL